VEPDRWRVCVVPANAGIPAPESSSGLQGSRVGARDDLGCAAPRLARGDGSLEGVRRRGECRDPRARVVKWVQGSRVGAWDDLVED